MPQKRKLEVRFTRQAEKDFIVIGDYLVANGSADALAYVERLAEVVDTLAQQPERCARVPESRGRDKGRRQLIFGSYRVIFNVVGQVVYILRIRHVSRHPLT